MSKPPIPVPARPEPSLVIYAPRWKLVSFYTKGEESHRSWVIDGLENYDGYTDSAVGVEAFIDSYATESHFTALKTVIGAVRRLSMVVTEQELKAAILLDHAITNPTPKEQPED